MPKRTLFTNITPLPAEVTREVAVAMLHDHDEMIELNPLVIEHHPIKTPRDAPADEFLDCVWQSLTDKIHYLPGGMVKGKVSYKACFHDLPLGLQTHIYAPLGLDIREKWSVGGSLPGEPPETRELGLDVPAQGLYLREDGDMRCSRFLTSFVRKNLDSAHHVLVERIFKKAQRIERHRETMSHQSYHTSTTNSQSVPSNNSFQTGSHMANSRIIHSPLLSQKSDQIPPLSPLSPNHLHPQGAPSLMDHPAFRGQQHNRSWSSQSGNSTLVDPRQSQAYTAPVNGQPQTKQFIAELPGSYYHTRNISAPQDNRVSVATELSSQEISRNSLTPQNQSDRGSTSGVSDPPANAPTGYRYNPQDFAQQENYHEDTAKGKSNRVSELPTAMDMEQVQRLR